MLVLPSDMGSGLEGLSGCPLSSHGEGRGRAGCLRRCAHMSTCYPGWQRAVGLLSRNSVGKGTQGQAWSQVDRCDPMSAGGKAQRLQGGPARHIAGDGSCGWCRAGTQAQGGAPAPRPGSAPWGRGDFVPV